MKKLLLGISFLLSASFAQAQWTNNGTWDYSFGTAAPATTYNTVGGTSSSTSTTPNFLPSPPSGTVGVHLTSTATGGSFTLNSDNTLKMQFPTASFVRFSAINVAVATDVVVNKFNIKFSAAITTVDGGNYLYSIGNNGGNLYNPISNSSVYKKSAEIFATLRFTPITTANSTDVKLEYRTGGDDNNGYYAVIDQTTFQKGSAYDVEIYCNNSSTDQIYTRGTGTGATTNTLPSNTFNIWVGGVQLGANYPRSNEVNGTIAAPTSTLSFANGVALNSFLFSGNGASAATGNVIITNPTLTYKVAVTPVSLTSFTGKKVNNGVELKWQTASELNNNYFEVLRSENGKDFTSIGTIKGNGTSQEIRNYNFTDVNPVSGANYYQLKQTDFDGTAKIVGETVAVTFGNNLPEFNVSSNGNTLKVFVFANNAGLNNLVITDMQGKKVAQDSRILAKGYNTFSINVGSLNAGVFVAQSSNADGTKVAKFIKD